MSHLLLCNQKKGSSHTHKHAREEKRKNERGPSRRQAGRKERQKGTAGALRQSRKSWSLLAVAERQGARAWRKAHTAAPGSSGSRGSSGPTNKNHFPPTCCDDATKRTAQARQAGGEERKEWLQNNCSLSLFLSLVLPCHKHAPRPRKSPPSGLARSPPQSSGAQLSRCPVVAY